MLLTGPRYRYNHTGEQRSQHQIAFLECISKDMCKNDGNILADTLILKEKLFRSCVVDA